MAWDPAVLRKYNTTGHFRLLNQLRGELKSNPLVRPQEGQTVGEVNRSKALQRAMEGRGGSSSRGGGTRRPSSGRESRPESSSHARTRIASSEDHSDTMHGPFTVVPLLSPEDNADVQGFRDRLNAVQLR